MNLIDRLRRSYVDHGTNYVQEAADEIERLTAHDQFLADANKQWMADCERLTAERDAYRSWGSQNEVSFSAEIMRLKSALLGAQALIAELQSERDALTDNLARAKQYHAAELADVVAERDSLQAQLTNIWK